jgi:hypothetical protein
MSNTKTMTSLTHVELSAELPTMQARTGLTKIKPGFLVLLRKRLNSALQLRAVPNEELTLANNGADEDWEAWLHAMGRAVR